jgi:hypothetical protein
MVHFPRVMQNAEKRQTSQGYETYYMCNINTITQKLSNVLL